jgi:hypothetical protein
VCPVFGLEEKWLLRKIHMSLKYRRDQGELQVEFTHTFTQHSSESNKETQGQNFAVIKTIQYTTKQTKTILKYPVLSVLKTLKNIFLQNTDVII